MRLLTFSLSIAFVVVSISPSLSFKKFPEEVRTAPVSSEDVLRKTGATIVLLKKHFLKEQSSIT